MKAAPFAWTLFLVLVATTVMPSCGGGGNSGGGGGGNPPATPTGLTATAGNAQVSLSWTPSSGATSYNVKRSTTSGAEVTISSPANSSYTDSSVTNGTKYFYVVSAVNSHGESANSTEVSATPNTVPAAPTGLTATPGNAQVALTWNTSAGATSYSVKRSTTSGSGYTTVSSPTGTSYTDTGLTNGTTYYYVVAAANSAGTSGNSSQVSATPNASTSRWISSRANSRSRRRCAPRPGEPAERSRPRRRCVAMRTWICWPRSMRRASS